MNFKSVFVMLLFVEIAAAGLDAVQVGCRQYRRPYKVNSLALCAFYTNRTLEHLKDKPNSVRLIQILL